MILNFSKIGLIDFKTVHTNLFTNNGKMHKMENRNSNIKKSYSTSEVFSLLSDVKSLTFHLNPIDRLLDVVDIV